MLSDHTRAIVSLIVGKDACASPFFVADLHSRLVSRLAGASVKLLEVCTVPFLRISLAVDNAVVRVCADNAGLFCAWVEGRNGMVHFDGVKTCRVSCDVLTDPRIQERLSALASDWSGEWPRDPLSAPWEAAQTACDEATKKGGGSRAPLVRYMDDRSFADAVQTVVALNA